MKTPIYALLASCLFALFSCGNSPGAKTAHLSVHIKDVISERAFIRSLSDTIIDTMIMREDSVFRIALELDEPVWLTLTLRKDKCKFPFSTELYLEPGDDIELTGDADNLYETITAAGKGAEENNFLFARFNIYYPECAGWPPNPNLAVNQFLFELDKMKEDLLAALEEHNRWGAMNEHFVDFEKRRAQYYWAYTKCIYPSSYRKIYDVPANIPVDFYDFLEDIDYGDEEMYYSKCRSKYVFLVSWYLDYATDKIKGVESFINEASFIAEKVGSQRMRDQFINDMLRDHLEKFSAEDLQKLQHFFEEHEDYAHFGEVVQKKLSTMIG